MKLITQCGMVWCDGKYEATSGFNLQRILLDGHINHLMIILHSRQFYADIFNNRIHCKGNTYKLGK